MKYKKISGFKGVQEYINSAELPDNYAQELENLDVDVELGRLTLRQDSTDKYTHSFTNIISAHEFTVETTGKVILILNDGGTLYWFEDGIYQGPLSLPTGATIDSTFTNNYFSYRDSVRITTGAGATNYVLWYGHLDVSMFKSDITFNGYKLNRSQILPDSSFNDVKSVVYLSGNYYVSHINSKWIHKLDASYRLVERFEIIPSTGSMSDNAMVSLAEDGTYLYVAWDYNGLTDNNILKVDANTHKVLYGQTLASVTLNDIAVNSTKIYVVHSGGVQEYTSANLTIGAFGAALFSDMNSIDCNNTYVWCGELDSAVPNTCVITRRAVGTLGTIAAKSAVVGINSDRFFSIYHSGSYIYGVLRNDNVYPGTDDYYNAVYKYADVALTTTATLTNIAKPAVLFETSSSELRTVSNVYGLTQEADPGTGIFIHNPYIANVNVWELGETTGNLVAGTYFYKISFVDYEGQEFPLTDLICVGCTGANNTVYLRVTFTKLSDEMYRVNYINLYRAFSSVSNDEKEPATNYKLLKTIDINDDKWVGVDIDASAPNDIYTYDYIDNDSEETISSVTYQENSGISENTKARYCNGKYYTYMSNRLYLGNIYSDGDGKAFPNQVAMSPVLQPDNIPYYDIINYPDTQGDSIKGLANIYNRLVAFKERHIGVFYGALLQNEYFPGISSDKGYVERNNTLYYLNEKGIFAFNGNINKRINEPIIVSYDAIVDYTDGCMFFFDDKDRIIISFPGEKSFLFNSLHNTWTIYDSSFSFKGYFKNTTNEYIGYTSTKIKKIFTDPAASVTFHYKSPLLVLDNDYTGFVDEVTQLQARMNYDNSPGGGTFINIKIYKPDPAGIADILLHTIQIEVGTPVSLNAITYFLTNVWGESFYFTIDGLVNRITIDSFVFKYNILGEYVSG